MRLGTAQPLATCSATTSQTRIRLGTRVLSVGTQRQQQRHAHQYARTPVVQWHLLGDADQAKPACICLILLAAPA